MKTVVVFTRHTLTAPQRAAIGSAEFLDATELAAQSVNSVAEGHSLLSQLIALAAPSDYVEIYGVIPVALRAALCARPKAVWGMKKVTLMVYESININRSKEGERPSFEFSEWVLVGEYLVPPAVSPR